MNRAALALLALGLVQMAGDLTGQSWLKALGAMTAASPAPRVFSAVKGYETYSTRFFIEWADGEGHRRELEITPEVYAQVQGPYNRRNVYGAALAYGPVLPAELREPVMRWALRGRRPLLEELGVMTSLVHPPLRVRFEPRAGIAVPASLPLLLEVPCQ